MDIELDTVKTLTPFVTPFISSIVNTYINPLLDKLKRNHELDKHIIEEAVSSKFSEYLTRAYIRNSFINVVVFQNQQIKLKDVYIPLTVVCSKDRKAIELDTYKDEFITAYKNVLIADTAGMGKSTISKFLFVSCVDHNKGIPILIELRKLEEGESIIDFIYNELNAIDEEFNKDFILKLIKRGDFIFFMDGFDEIPQERRESVTSELQDFISKANNSHFLLTSRLEQSIASFADFQGFRIKPLAAEEAFLLLRKYDRGEPLSEEIISKIKGEPLKSVKEFLTNPFLVSLLYKSYSFKPTIPFKKHIFYGQVYEALFENHDYSKGGGFNRQKHSGLDIDEFRKVLRLLAFKTVTLNQVEYNKVELLTLLKKSKEHCQDVAFKETQFVRDLVTTVPLFIKEGEYYRWAHKSIQEYFAAQFIYVDARELQRRILDGIYYNSANQKYVNVLDLYIEMDFKTFRRVLIYHLICDFISYYDSTYKDIDRSLISESEIHLRKSLTFPGLYSIVDFPTFEAWTSNVDGVIQENIILKFSRDFLSAVPGSEAWRYMRTSAAPIKTDKPPFLLFRMNTGPDLILNLLPDKDDCGLLDTRVTTWDKIPIATEQLLGDLKSGNFPIDDNPESLVNDPHNFNLLGTILTVHNHQYLDINKCRQLKRLIEEEVNEAAQCDFLLEDV